MFNLFAIVPYFMMIGLAYYMNSKKIRDTKIQILLLSFLEATYGYLFLLLFFLQNFYPQTWFYIFTFIFILIMSLVLYFFFTGTYEDSDLQIETIKNITVIFTLTVLPIFVFLTIYRFFPFYIQIPFALASTALLLFLSLYIRNYLKSFYKTIGLKISLMGMGGKLWLMWVVPVFLILIMVFFQFPSNKVGEFLNLSNNAGYFSFDDFPTDINNNYYQTEILKFNIDFEVIEDELITDYFYDDTYVYLYTSKNRLLVYSIDDGVMVLEQYLGLPPDEYLSGTNLGGLNTDNSFMFYDNNLILFGRYNTYLITKDSATLILENTNEFRKLLYIDNELYYIVDDSSLIFDVYKLEGTDKVFYETIDLTGTNYSGLTIISGTLFYSSNNLNTLYSDTSISFEILDGYQIYDNANQIMYYTAIGESITVYNKMESDGTVSNIKLNRAHYITGIILEDNIYYTKKYIEEIERIEIVNSNFEIDSIFNHLETDLFLVFNSYYDNYISNYTVNNDLLEYLEVEKSQDFTTLSVYYLDEKDVDIDFPFYSHYSMWIFVPIMIAFFIPVTDYRATISVLDLSKTANNKSK